MADLNYVVISPVKNEERFVEATLDSMARQTHRPLRWVIIDDGSTDSTPQIIERYVAANPFIRMVRLDTKAPRQPGGAVIRAFNHGLEHIADLQADAIIKLDCDLRFGPDYFAEIFKRMAANEKLGIVSGFYSEKQGERWIAIEMPSYHAAGACKVIRWKCWREIGGFIAAKGWDTVDEIRAMARGWTTTHFTDLEMQHLKPEGSGIGQVRTNVMLGEIYRLTGGGSLFFLLKLIKRLATPPFVVGSAAMLWGYLRAILQRKPLLVSSDEARHYNRLLIDRLLPFSR
jgi:biofilm PGA synthesis N-glycosyltransferase PgaC